MPTIAETYRMLDEYPGIIKEITKVNAEINEYMTGLGQNCISITQNYGKIASTPVHKLANDPVYRAYQQMGKVNIEYQRKITHAANRIFELMERKTKIDFGLEGLSINERKILIMRCFERMKWERIADKMDYSVCQCQRIKSIAVKKLAENMSKT